MTTARAVRPVAGPVSARVQPPGSKSLTIRALTAAALADGVSHLYGPLLAEDPEAMIRLLASLGVEVRAGGDPWVVYGTGGRLVGGGSVDVGESGLTARVALVLAALAEGETTVDGRGRLRERPMEPLIEVLRSQGVSITSRRGRLPATVVGTGGLWGGSLTIDASRTSQFASALLLAAPLTRQPSRLRIDDLRGSQGYLDLTVSVLRAFGAEVTPTITGFEVERGGYRPADYLVEPDASAAAYPLVAAAITGGTAEVSGLGPGSAQPDIAVVARLEDMGCASRAGDTGLVLDASGVELEGIDADLAPTPDGAVALAVACAFASGPSRLRNLGSLRHKESDRLAALTSELGRLGGSARVEGDALLIEPTPLRPAVIDPHGDHRIAMALALVGLRVEGVEVANPGVVDKTWPGFWEMLDHMATA